MGQSNLQNSRPRRRRSDHIGKKGLSLFSQSCKLMLIRYKLLTDISPLDWVREQRPGELFWKYLWPADLRCRIFSRPCEGNVSMTILTVHLLSNENFHEQLPVDIYIILRLYETTWQGGPGPSQLISQSPALSSGETTSFIPGVRDLPGETVWSKTPNTKKRNL